MYKRNVVSSVKIVLRILKAKGKDEHKRDPFDIKNVV